MPGLANLVRVVSATTGTGAVTLAGAVTGFLTPAQAGMVSGRVYAYAIEASYVVSGDDQIPTAREVGSGLWNGTTLTRNVVNSTNGNALLNLTGDEQVIVSLTTGVFVEGANCYATAQFDKAANTTLANIPGLSLNVEAGAAYAFRAVIIMVCSAAGGCKFALSGTATETFPGTQFKFKTYTGTTLNTHDLVAALNSIGGASTTAASVCEIEGVVLVNAAGTLTIQFAQNVASGTSSVLIGSSLRAWKIG